MGERMTIFSRDFDSCPCCGGEVVSREIYWNADLRTLSGRGAVVRLTPTEAEIIDALWRGRSRKVYSLDQLASRVYADRIDGGPTTKVLSAQLVMLRRKIAPLGLSIPKRGGRGSEYCIVGDLVAVPRLKDAA